MQSPVVGDPSRPLEVAYKRLASGLHELIVTDELDSEADISRPIVQAQIARKKGAKLVEAKEGFLRALKCDRRRALPLVLLIANIAVLNNETSLRNIQVIHYLLDAGPNCSDCRFELATGHSKRLHPVASIKV